ncbi:uncharacterized protein MELLADRAFT_70355 [Melampsora larici-populina 98AG31]|uniref:Uncharacterized protein n=1 Tax=Melampsora larici-populina (strain 98AG31 / pathotype 3-4-7) TaxID=747676 RepID=F4SEN3_MELLP|nr:uncharacterized protein MELLADRAFT_70355 [Melampsora larici-populina 98AG31]EGF96893.1 hypothetical protein MELLADRAFT_70355 [Melampsora larici-populina 98AG31]
MGGDIIEGGVQLVFEYLEEWRKQDIALQYSQKQAKLLEMKRKADDKRVLADVTNVKQIPTGPAAATKKKRRSSAQVKADKEAAILKADFNRRCLKWMKEDNVPADKLDEREEAYQNEPVETLKLIFAILGFKLLNPKAMDISQRFPRPALPFIVLTKCESCIQLISAMNGDDTMIKPDE